MEENYDPANCYSKGERLKTSGAHSFELCRERNFADAELLKQQDGHVAVESALSVRNAHGRESQLCAAAATTCTGDALTSTSKLPGFHTCPWLVMCAYIRPEAVALL
jgi:hypothetical protein